MSLKTKTREVILDYSKSHSLEETLALSKALLDTSLHKGRNKDMSTVGIVFGEIGESVLEVMLSHYIKSRNLKDWFYSPSLVIKDIDTLNSEFLTEIDMVLVSPYKIYLFEAKTYSGMKTIVGSGKIIREKGKDFDVGSQQKLHVRVFDSTFSPFRRKLASPLHGYSLPLFDFSTFSFEDQRSDSWKELMPILTPDNLFDFLDKQQTKHIIWNVEKVRKVVGLIEKKNIQYDLHSKHLSYVSNLHRNKRQ